MWSSSTRTAADPAYGCENGSAKAAIGMNQTPDTLASIQNTQQITSASPKIGHCLARTEPRSPADLLIFRATP
jgi:hypothetical protein